MLAIVLLPEPDKPREPEDRGPVRVQPGARRLVDHEALAVDVGRPPQAERDHARPDGRVREAIDQDEGAGLSILGVGIEGHRGRRRQIADADLVQCERDRPRCARAC